MNGLGSLILVDLSATFISKYFYPCQEVHHNRRWFLIHAYINLLATVYNFSDTFLVLSQPDIYPPLQMSADSWYATNIVIMGHLYHMVVFYPYLKDHEWFHHIIMMGFNGVSIYILQNKAQAACAFFLCGLPGLIDYFMLWNIKMGWMDKRIEKDIYLYLTTYVRSPGAVMITYASIPHLYSQYANEEYGMFFYGSFLIGLNFWNGQHYMMKSCIDYGKLK
jgi:hypothetical protein